MKVERDQLQMSYSLLETERDQLQTNYSSLVMAKEHYIPFFHLSSAERLKACPQGWTCFSSKLYYISTERKSWSESQKDCKERGADLVIINNEEEQDFISQFTGPFWIGLSDREREGTWKWVDGTTLQEGQGYWKENQPDNYNENESCAETAKSNSQKTWNDFQCDEKLSWICEKEG
uniref:C-type lectin domain-containing protein n=1 Tax=Scleropages formosus TaxID=113540 RepID=A0A8C9SF31_SCLFO